MIVVEFNQNHPTPDDEYQRNEPKSQALNQQRLVRMLTR
jgi:hypothetical protein